MKKKLLQLLLKEQAIKFDGPFITKSQRICPYFINLGNVCNGLLLRKLGSFYAKTINKKFGTKPNNIFGPAYKGTILAIVSAIQFAARTKQPITFTSNRKETKDHGEGGILIGYQYKGNENVIIVDDVLTSGSSIIESINILNKYNVNIIGVVVCIDRQEYGTQKNISAKQEIEELYNIPIVSILQLSDIIEFLHENKIYGKKWINDELYEKCKNYMNQYCILKNT